MAKPNRGWAIKYLPGRPGRGRGVCPICKRTGVKLLWSNVVGDTTVYVCKHCSSKA